MSQVLLGIFLRAPGLCSRCQVTGRASTSSRAPAGRRSTLSLRRPPPGLVPALGRTWGNESINTTAPARLSSALLLLHHAMHALRFDYLLYHRPRPIPSGVPESPVPCSRLTR
ncbi:hypothetical protein BS50DRAFT_569456 [Corynespora cassiicola Philippines]|uniref:Uncharacterized protein n=1 Tax=Corynespora cassiicola Philippines TaxID=1448308 RepID=A0A2T2P2W3_CORCC|nr:hypothetical protein BS50DRAFT_569456 [Corynespora cassiicola Philippines]